MRLFQQINGINKKRICKFIVVTILFISVSSIFLNSSIVVYAWSAGGLRSTIASIIVSMLMSSGAGVTNMDWLNQLNTAYGVESSIGTLENAISQGLLTESAGTLIDTGLSDAIMANTAYTDLGLDALFTTTADDALIQAGTVAASGGANIAAESIGAITLGTVGQAFVAVGAGIGLGVLANHFIEKFKTAMYSGTEITQDEINTMIQNGEYVCWKTSYEGKKLYYVYDPSVFFQFHYLASNNYYRCCLYSFDGNAHPYRVYQVQNNSWYNYSGATENSTSYAGQDWQPQINESDINSYVSGVRGGTISPHENYSPDVIGSGGNQKGTYSNQDGYIFPYLTPYYNPQEKGLRPIPMDDYLDFAQDAIDNTENGDVEEIQGNLFDNFIDPYLEEQETPVIPEPDPDYTNPDAIPEQPDYTPKTPVSSSDINDSDPYTTPDLMDRFPFCIPSDVLSIFQKFKMSREAPVIDWEFQYDEIGLDHHLVIDFEDFDDVASLLRTLELILFVVGLGVATRKLIGV